MGVQSDAAALTDLIHGAVYGGSSWQDFLDRVRLLLPNGQAVLFFHHAGAGAFPLSAGSDAEHLAAYKAHYSNINPWMPHAATRPLGLVCQADEMLPRAKLQATEYYNEFLKPQDIQTGFGVTIRREEGCNYLFSVMCGDVEDAEAAMVKATLQALVPHLRRAFDFYRKGPHTCGIGPAWNEQTVLPKARGILRVGPGSRILFADDTALRVCEQSGCLSVGLFSRFSCTSSAITEHVAAELAAWDGGASAPSARTFHLSQGGSALPLRVTVFRPGGTSVAFFRGPECVVHIEDPAADIDAAVEEFAETHALSRAERRVIAGLASGRPLSAIAAENGTAVETTRKQLKQVFAKTGLRRQSDLLRHVCVMAGAPRNGLIR